MSLNKHKDFNKSTKRITLQSVLPFWRGVGGGLIMMLLLFSSCTDEITPTLAEAPQIVVIDAWITNKPEPQVIKIMGTQPYFDNSLPTGLSGAIVQVADENLKVYDFIETAPGEYTWTPQVGETFGEIGLQYGLNVEYNGVMYNSCLLYTSPSPRDATLSRMPSSA